MRIDYRKAPLSNGFEYGGGVYGEPLHAGIEWNDRLPILQNSGQVVPEDVGRFLLDSEVGMADEIDFRAASPLQTYLYGGEQNGWHDFVSCAPMGSLVVSIRSLGDDRWETIVEDDRVTWTAADAENLREGAARFFREQHPDLKIEMEA